jgi:recombination protein RecA
MSQALRKLPGSINRSKTCLLFTNQIREKVGVMFGSPETTPGGRALKFYASVRMDIRRIATIKDNSGTAVGSRARVKVVKNKVAPPFTEGEFDILYAEGISWEGSILDMAMDLNLIERRGSWLSLDGTQLGQGRDAAREAMKENPDLQKTLMEKIETALEEKRTVKKK